jgi:phospholipid/cholesterol/gamma-HCH transport system substrate-binding protein
MKQEQINYLTVGSFVLLMLAVLLFSLYRITGASLNRDAYYVVYQDVSGLKPGTSVTYSGYPIGTVLDIRPLRTEQGTRYRLTLGVQSGWLIPEDSQARIVMPGILTEKQIDISEGRSRQPLRPGDTLAGQEAPDLMALLNLLGGDLQDIADSSLKPMLANFNEVSLQLRRLLSTENQQQLADLFHNTDAMTQSLTRLTNSLDQATGQMQSLLDNSNRLLSQSDADIRRSVQDLRHTLETVAQSIDGIMHNFELSSRNMQELSRELRANPGLLLGGREPADQADQVGEQP